MASLFEDPSSWSLTTAGGIPYKMMGMDGGFSMMDGHTNISVLIPSTDLVAFCTELLPTTLTIGAVTVPLYKKFSSLNLAVLEIDYKQFDTSKPIDPFLDDPDAPLGTYFPVIECDIKLGVPPTSSSSNPSTFLEVSADATGEFIHSPPTNTQSQAMTSTGPTATPTPSGSPTKIRTPVLPHTILVPQTSWNLNWKLIPLTVFQDYVEPRLDLLMGKVNQYDFQMTHVSVPETLLFAGYNHRYAYTWRDQNWDTPYVDLTLKVIEKRIVKDNIVRGHNDVWRPGYGWDRLLINGYPTYESIDFNTLFD